MKVQKKNKVMSKSAFIKAMMEEEKRKRKRLAQAKKEEAKKSTLNVSKEENVKARVECPTSRTTKGLVRNTKSAMGVKTGVVEDKSTVVKTKKQSIKNKSRAGKKSTLPKKIVLTERGDEIFDIKISYSNSKPSMYGAELEECVLKDGNIQIGFVVNGSEENQVIAVKAKRKSVRRKKTSESVQLTFVS